MIKLVENLLIYISKLKIAGKFIIQVNLINNYNSMNESRDLLTIMTASTVDILDYLELVWSVK